MVWLNELIIIHTVSCEKTIRILKCLRLTAFKSSAGSLTGPYLIFYCLLLAALSVGTIFMYIKGPNVLYVGSSGILWPCLIFLVYCSIVRFLHLSSLNSLIVMLRDFKKFRLIWNKFSLIRAERVGKWKSLVTDSERKLEQKVAEIGQDKRITRE